MTGDDKNPRADFGSPVRRRRRPLASPLTRRILSVNILALAILASGLLYLNRYEENLIQAEIKALTVQGEIFAGALGQGAFRTRPGGKAELYPSVAGPMLRRLVRVTGAYGRLFAAEGALLSDSRRLAGTKGGVVQTILLPPPSEESGLEKFFGGVYEKIVALLPGRRDLPRFSDPVDDGVGGYPEVREALNGTIAHRLRVDADGRLMITVAVPVQRFKEVIGALLLTEEASKIDEAVREVRLDIVMVFLVALGITILLSLYLAGTIVRPLHRLAMAADEVRLAPGREHLIQGFENRTDEIGDLAADLNAMTQALAQRLGAIESFAADVAHEIKNPLTSLRSAVETASRLQDPEQQKKLMGIILDDVQRLDRLITDISAASRLDAELSRVEREKLDLEKTLSALVQVHATAGVKDRAMVEFKTEGTGPFQVIGEEGRLVQVFQNLLSNGFSFAPADGRVVLTLSRRDRWVIATVEDDGPGIPAGSLETIFDRFYSERPTSEQFGTHSGLGLSISRQIIEAHGGEIFARNREGPDGTVTGAIFTVRLPAA